jgi:hypothetical protein
MQAIMPPHCAVEGEGGSSKTLPHSRATDIVFDRLVGLIIE